MVKKIEVSRDEVLHYPWVDHTWVYIYCDKNEVTANPMFGRLLKALFKYGIKATTGKPFDGIEWQDDYLFVQHKTNEIIDILKDACRWILTCGLVVNDPTSDKGIFFEKNREIYFEILRETYKILEEKQYKYFFQRVDGRD